MFKEVWASLKKPALQPRAEQATGEGRGFCSWTRRQLHPMTLCRRLRFSKPPWPYLEDHCDSLGRCSHEDKGQRALGKITGLRRPEGVMLYVTEGHRVFLLKGFT